MGGGIGLILEWRIRIDLINFECRAGTDLVFVWMVEIGLAFEPGHRNLLNFRVGI